MDDIGLLRLQMEWGADEALDDLPLDRLTPVPRPREVARLAPTAAPIAAVASPPADRALAAAGQAASLDALREAVAAFDGCPLRDTATNLVFASGDMTARAVLIGDPPNADDDRSGQAFAGVDGQLLDQMLASAGLTRAAFLLTPLLPWRPPGGRPANAAEVTVCLPFLHRLIALAGPRLLVIAGAQAVRALIGGRPRVQGATRGAECRIPGLATPVEAILLPFPATALRTAAARKEAWAGLRRVRRIMDA